MHHNREITVKKINNIYYTEVIICKDLITAEGESAIKAVSNLITKVRVFHPKSYYIKDYSLSSNKVGKEKLYHHNVSVKGKNNRYCAKIYIEMYVPM
jgi:hypothetical protein